MNPVLCLLIVLVRAALACVTVPVVNTGAALVYLCNDTFHVAAPELDELAVIRGRVNCTAVAELVFAKVEGYPIWEARLVAPAGPYFAYVELQYERLDPQDVFGSTPVRVPLVLDHRFEHGGSVRAGGDRCERDGSLFARGGYWLASPVTARYGVQDAARAVYVPAGCALPDAPRRPLGVCFFGDSHVRHLYDEWTGALESLPEAEGTVRAVAESKTSSYVDDPYGECFGGGMPLGTTGRHASRVHTLLSWRSRCRPANECSVALLGFGQWFVSHAIGDSSRAPRVSAYAYAARVVEALRKANESHARVVWLTTHPLGERWPSMYTRPPTEWRTDGVLRAYNRAAARAAAGSGFEVFDLFGMANAVHDLTYDGSHYKAPVEWEIVRMVAHALGGT